MGKVLQIDSRISPPGERRNLKKYARRWMRRAGKRGLDDAPRVYRYAGYS